MSAEPHGAARSIAELARRGTDAPAIIVPGGPTLSYAALDRAAAGFAHTLQQRGARPGDRLVLANANTPAFFVALFGAARAGLVAVPLDPGLAAAELATLLAHARPHAVVVDERSAAIFAALDAPLLAVGGDGEPAPVATPEAALVLYTSGTTGAPRGAVHSHAGLLAKVEAIRAWFQLTPEDRALCILPTHFGHGLVSACLTMLHAGGALVLCRPFDAELLPRVLALADEHAVTTFSTVPTIARLLLRMPAARPRRLRYVTCASAPLQAHEVDAFEAHLGVPLLNCYGLTEAGTWSALSPLSADRDRRSVGMPVGCRFRATADNRILPAGEVGELEVAGPSIMLGYDGDPAATARVLRDGWLATGDLGSVAADGAITLAGRSKELIIRAGANIYPAEIEGILLRHPDVAEAYVLGLPHTLLGEQVGAAIVTRDGRALSDTELIRHCRTALAPYKCPETIRFVPAVPKTSRGKVSRAALRSLF